MDQTKKIPLALLLLRVGVFIVFVVWSLDKFLRPDHTAMVFQSFYFFPPFQPIFSYCIGVVQLAITIGFVLGIKKTFTYGAVFIMHLISTLTSYKQYCAPYEGPNILFFAAWPMLAACYVLFMLREWDTIGMLGCKRLRGNDKIQ